MDQNSRMAARLKQHSKNTCSNIRHSNKIFFACLTVYGSFLTSANMFDTWAPTVNLSWASLIQASPFDFFQSSVNARDMASVNVTASVATPLGTVDKSVVSGGSVTSSPTSGVTKS